MASPPTAGSGPAWRILIAGGGIASLALALALRRFAGEAVSVTIAEPSGHGGRHDGRAYALSPGSVAMLETLGVWDRIASRAQPIAGMRITDSRLADAVRPAYLGFEQDGPGTLGYLLDASPVAEALGEACREAGIDFANGAVSDPQASGARIGFRLADEPAFAHLLVAADGARSKLREAAGIGWVGQRYSQLALVGTIEHERDHEGVAVQHFLPAGPFAILPLAGAGRHLPYRSSIVWTEEERRAKALLDGTDEARLEALETRFGPELGRIALEGRLGGFPLGLGLARRFVAPRLALLGDAAHVIHPLAGQGLNLGLADAASLAEHVVETVRLGLDPGATDVLAAYERDRRFDAVLLAGLTDGLNRLFSNDSLPVRALRDLGLGLVDRAGGVKAFFSGEAAGTTRRAPRLMRGETL